MSRAYFITLAWVTLMVMYADARFINKVDVIEIVTCTEAYDDTDTSSSVLRNF